MNQNTNSEINGNMNLKITIPKASLSFLVIQKKINYSQWEFSLIYCSSIQF